MRENMHCAKIKEDIIKRAREDEKFKQELMKNPKEVLGQFGIQVPEEVEIKVVEESTGGLYLVLPFDHSNLRKYEKPELKGIDAVNDELSPDALENVAGGGGGNCLSGLLDFGICHSGLIA